MAVKRYIHYPSHMAELTPQKLAAANYHGYQKYVTEEDYAALEGQLNLMSKSREAWKENATALEKERDALQAECERLRADRQTLRDLLGVYGIPYPTTESRHEAE